MQEMRENEFRPSVWKQTENGDWKMFFNLNEETNIKAESESQIKSIFDSANKKSLKTGSLVMTPKGIGRLKRLDNKIATIKFLNDEHEETFEDSLILAEFPIFLRILDKDISNWYRIMVPPNGSIESLKRQIEELKIVDSNNSNFIMIYNGAETKDDFFFDQMDLRPGVKFLLCGLKMTQNKLCRFSVTYNWWYTYNTDGVTFSVNKRIKLCGIGLYGSHESKTQNGTIKIFEGVSSGMGATLYEEPAEIPAAPDQNSAVIPINFKKSINIKPHLDYTVQLICNNYCYLYYGGGGKASIEGERGLEFVFKYTPGSSHGTGVESGNFPEFYYYY